MKKKIISTKTPELSDPPVSTYKLSRDEHETHLYIDEVDGCWTADTSIQRDINKFRKQGWTIKNEFKYADGTIKAVEFTAPRNAMSIGKAIRAKSNMTEEQRQANGDRMRELALNKKKLKATGLQLD